MRRSLVVLAAACVAAALFQTPPAGALDFTYAECVVTAHERYGAVDQVDLYLTCVGIGSGAGDWSLSGSGSITESCLSESGEYAVSGSRPGGGTVSGTLRLERVGSAVAVIMEVQDYTLLGPAAWIGTGLCPLNAPSGGTVLGKATLTGNS